MCFRIIVGFISLFMVYGIAQANDDSYMAQQLIKQRSTLSNQEKETLKSIDREGLKHIQNIMNKKAEDKEERYVFISLTIPEQGLIALIKQAKQHGFIPIMRGFKEGSYKKTVIALDEIIKKTEYGVIIDPELFKEFNIKAVPTFIITKSKKICLDNKSCMARNHNKLSGNVTAEFALRELSTRGDKL